MMKGIVFFMVLCAAVHTHFRKDPSRCSPSNGYRCPPSAPCCSKWGFCGLAEHCSPGICISGCPNGGAGGAGAAIVPATTTHIDDKAPVAFEAFGTVFGLDVHLGCANPTHATLTFDDGVDAKLMSRLLDVLTAKNVTAAFFVLGNTLDYWHDTDRKRTNDDCKQNREILQRAHSLGHEIGIHTFDHTRLPPLSDAQVQYQADHTSSLIKSTINKAPRFFRAPEGQLSVRVVRLLKSLGYLIVHWSHDTCDWKYHKWHPEYLIRIANETIHDSPAKSKGPILLQHDNIKETVDQQSKIIDTIKAKGYTIVPLSVCINEQPYRSETATDGIVTGQDGQVHGLTNMDAPAKPCTVLDFLTLQWCKCFGLSKPWCTPQCT